VVLKEPAKPASQILGFSDDASDMLKMFLEQLSEDLADIEKNGLLPGVGPQADAPVLRGWIQASPRGPRYI